MSNFGFVGLIEQSFVTGFNRKCYWASTNELGEASISKSYGTGWKSDHHIAWWM